METCKHNLMVLCEKQDKCESCGWNPEVMKTRKEALRKELENENRHV